MRYAVVTAQGAIHNIVEADADRYVPPDGMTLREATPDDEAYAAEHIPGYAPAGD